MISGWYQIIIGKCNKNNLVNIKSFLKLQLLFNKAVRTVTAAETLNAISRLILLGK